MKGMRNPRLSGWWNAPPEWRSLLFVIDLCVGRMNTAPGLAADGILQRDVKQNAHSDANHVGFALIHVVGLSQEALTAGGRAVPEPRVCHIHRRAKTLTAAARLGSKLSSLWWRFRVKTLIYWFKRGAPCMPDTCQSSQLSRGSFPELCFQRGAGWHSGEREEWTLVGIVPVWESKLPSWSVQEVIPNLLVAWWRRDACDDRAMRWGWAVPSRTAQGGSRYLQSLLPSL